MARKGKAKAKQVSKDKTLSDFVKGVTSGEVYFRTAKKGKKKK